MKFSLLPFFGIFVGNFELCHTRTKCTPRTFEEPLLVSGKCGTKHYYFPTRDVLVNTISNYAFYQNVMIFGVQASHATKLLQDSGALGNKSAIWYSQKLSWSVFSAVELVSEAVKLAISDFCKENPFTDSYEFQ